MALVIFVAEVRTKSSADSISSLPAEPGREAVAIRPSGSPVLKKKSPAETGAASTATTTGTNSKQVRTLMNHHLL